MAIINNNSISLNEIRLKAQEIFLSNPFDERAKKVFLEACLKEIIKEDDNFFDLFGASLDAGLSPEEKLSTIIILYFFFKNNERFFPTNPRPPVINIVFFILNLNFFE